MTGHDLDLEAIRSISENGNVRANRDQVRMLIAEVEALRAKLAAVEEGWYQDRAALAAVRDWAMTNEIAAPPLDWASLGRILAAVEQDEPKRSPKLTAPRDASGSTHPLDDCPCPSCDPKQEQS